MDSIAVATARWHFHHSALVEDDGIILGSASVAQMRENIGMAERADADGPLPPEVLAAFEAAWEEELKGDSPPVYPGMGHMPAARL